MHTIWWIYPRKEPFLSYICAPTNCKGFKFFEVNVNRKEGLLLMIQHGKQYQNDSLIDVLFIIASFNV